MSSDQVVKIGISKSSDTCKAVAEFYQSVYQDDMALVIFFCSPDHDLKIITEQFNQLFGDTQIVGCTTAGEIGPNGYHDGAITGFSFAKNAFAIETHCFNQLNHFSIPDSTTSVKQMLANMNEKNGPINATNSFGFLLVDGLSVKEENVISAIYNAIGDLSVFGGSAGDKLDFKNTFIYHRGQFHKNSAVFILINTTHPFKVFKTQHFVESDKKMVITGAEPEKRIVTEINGEPAAEEYARIVGLEGVELTPMLFASYPVVLKVGGMYYVRAIQKVNEDKSLTFYCAIDEGLVLTVATGQDIAKNLLDSFEQVKNEIGNPQLIIGCDCILRNLELNDKGLRQDVGKILSDHNVVGFSTYGEQYQAMHVNQTFTGVAIA